MQHITFFCPEKDHSLKIFTSKKGLSILTLGNLCPDGGRRKNTVCETVKVKIKIKKIMVKHMQEM